MQIVVGILLFVRLRVSLFLFVLVSCFTFPFLLDGNNNVKYV